MYSPDGVAVQVPRKDAAAWFLANKAGFAAGPMPVVSSRGEVRVIDAADAAKAFRSGQYAPATSEEERHQALVNFAHTGRGAVDAAVAGLVRHGSLGFAEPAVTRALESETGQPGAEVARTLQRERPYLNFAGAAAGEVAGLAAMEGAGKAIGAGVRALRGGEVAEAARAGVAKTAAEMGTPAKPFVPGTAAAARPATVTGRMVAEAAPRDEAIERFALGEQQSIADADHAAAVERGLRERLAIEEMAPTGEAINGPVPSFGERAAGAPAPSLPADATAWLDRGIGVEHGNLAGGAERTWIESPPGLAPRSALTAAEEGRLGLGPRFHVEPTALEAPALAERAASEPIALSTHDPAYWTRELDLEVAPGVTFRQAEAARTAEAMHAPAPFPTGTVRAAGEGIGDAGGLGIGPGVAPAAERAGVDVLGEANAARSLAPPVVAPAVRNPLITASSAAGIAREAGFGAAYAAGHEVSEQTLLGNPVTAEQIGLAAGKGALLGGGIGFLAQLAPRLAGASLDATMGRVAGELGNEGKNRALGEWLQRHADEWTNRAAGANKAWLNALKGNVVGDPVLDEAGRFIGRTNPKAVVADEIRKAMGGELHLSPEKIDEAVRAAHADAGKSIGSVRQSVASLQIPKNDVLAVVRDLRAPYEAVSRETGNTVPAAGADAEYNALTKWMDQFNDTHGDGVTMDELQAARDRLKKAYSGKRPFDTTSIPKQEAQQIRNRLERVWEQTVEAKNPEVMAPYAEAKRTYHALSFAKDMTADLLARAEGNLPVGGAVGAMMGAAGLARTGVHGGLAAVGATWAARRYGASVVANTLVRLASLDAAADAAAVMESRMAQASSAVARGAPKDVPVSDAASLGETAQQTWDRVAPKVLEAQQNPSVVAQRLAATYGDVARDTPHLALEAARAEVAAMAVISAAMPRPAPTVATFQPAPFVPSQTAQVRFQRVVQAVEGGPTVVAQQLASGQLFPEALDALRKVTPAIAAHQQTSILADIERRQADGETVPPFVLRAVSQAYGVPLAQGVSRERVQANAASFAAIGAAVAAPDDTGSENHGAGKGVRSGAAAQSHPIRGNRVDLAGTSRLENQQADSLSGGGR